jgi:U32 family peptidase
MLKIAAPFQGKKEVDELIGAGADELYCGYLSAEWKRKYTDFEFERKGGGSNFTDLKELRSAVELAHEKNTPVFLALNGLYVNAQYPVLLNIVNQAETVDFDGFIVADIGLLLTLKERKTRKAIHISTGGTAFNSHAVDFYRNLGASRIILDRQTTLRSMKELPARAPDIDFEAFILNTLCVNIDGFCTYFHPNESARHVDFDRWKKGTVRVMRKFVPDTPDDPCCMPYAIQAFDSRGARVRDRSIRPVLFKHLVDGRECGACAMYDISRTGVKTVKIVGRQLSPSARLTSVRFISRARDILAQDKDIGKKVYIRKVQELYREMFGYRGKCRGNNCYYPGVICSTER